MKHLENVLIGFASIFDGFSTKRRYISNYGGFRKDSDLLANDVRVFYKDLRKQTNSAYGSYTTSSSQKR
jgi:hypothetical protein